MCGPAALLVAGLVVAAAGTATEVKQQRDQAQFQIDLTKNEKAAQQKAAALRREDRRRRLRRAIAEQKVLFGASGTDIDSTILAETAEEFAREQFNDDFNLKRSILNLEASIENLRASRSNAVRNGIINFGSKAIGTIAGSGAVGGSGAAGGSGFTGGSGSGLATTSASTAGGGTTTGGGGGFTASSAA